MYVLLRACSLIMECTLKWQELETLGKSDLVTPSLRWNQGYNLYGTQTLLFHSLFKICTKPPPNNNSSRQGALKGEE